MIQGIIQWADNILCVHGGWMYGDGGIMTKATYENTIRRNDGIVVQRGGRSRIALINYERIPERFKEAIELKIGDVYEYVKENELLKYIKEDQKALNFYRDYRFGDDRKIPVEAQLEYYTNVKVVCAVYEIISVRKAMRQKHGKKSMGAVWDEIAQSVEKLDKRRFPHNLPKNTRRLQEKVSDYFKEGYEVFIHNGFCNKNKEKVNDEVKFWLLAQWANNVDRITSENHLLDVYNAHAEEQRKISRENEKVWQEIKSANTLHNFLYSDGIQVLWWGARYGELKTKEKFIYQHSTLLPTMRNSLWYSDGTKMNLFYRDENGNRATMFVYEILDVYSEVFVGYEFCKTENFEAQRAAFKRAFEFTKEKPYQLSFDNQGGHKKMDSTSFLPKLAKLAINTQPYNGKSKTIESAFGRFQSQFLKRSNRFTGQNITAKRDESKANMEWVLANEENLPSMEEVKAFYLKYREEWNNAKHYKTGISRMEMYKTSVNPEVSKITTEDMRDLFCVEHDNQVRVTAYGVSFSVDKKKYTYMAYDGDAPDVRWIADHVDKKYVAKYDPSDMEEVHLYEDSATRGLRYVLTMETKFGIHRGIQEQEEWEAKYIQEVEDTKKSVRVEIRDEMDEILKEHNLLPEQHGLNSPLLKGIESSRKAQKTDVVKTRKAKKQRTKGIAEVQKDLSNMVALDDMEAVDAMLDKVNDKHPLPKKKSIYSQF